MNGLKRYLFAVLIFFTTVCFAQQLMSYYHPKFVGLSTDINPRLLKTEESPDMSNFTLDEIGSIEEREVFGKYNATSGVLGNNPVTLLKKFYTTTAKYFVAGAGSKLSAGSAGAFTDDITLTANTVVPANYWDAETFNNRLYLFNKSINMWSWSGTGDARELGYPDGKCQYGAVHKSRLWATGDETYPFRLWFSSLSNGDDWLTTGGFVDLPDMTATITGIESWGGYLYIFTETDIYTLTGYNENNFTLVKSTSDVGAIAPRSIEVTDIGIIFLARTGVFVFNGSKSYSLSDKINNKINGISRTKIKDACGMWDGEGRYWLSYASSTSSYNNKILIYDTVLKEWYAFDNVNINYFERAYGGTDKGELYGGSSLSDGTVWQLQEATGEESITIDSQTSFKNGATFNTVIDGIEASPILELLGYEVSNSDTLLLRFNGSDGDTTTTDASTTGNSVVLNGAVLDTEYYYDGSSSCEFDGTNDRITIAPPATDWQIVNQNDDIWTVDLWVKHDDHTGEEGYFNLYIDDSNYMILTHRDGTGIDFDVIRVGVALVDMTPGGEITDTNWHHVALVCYGTGATTNYGIYKDGRIISYLQDNSTTTYDAGTLNVGSGRGATFFFDGNIDDFRISHFNRFNASPDAGLTDTIIVPPFNNGEYNSKTFVINASAQSSLGTISWSELLTSNSDIQITTRTGETDDTVYFNNWEPWASTSTVISRATDSSVFTTSDATNFRITSPSTPQTRNILYYEPDDNASPNCIQFAVSGAVSKNDYGTGYFSQVDLSAYKWIGAWIKSPTTGNSVKLQFGERTNNELTTTHNTVEPNTWEYHYMPLGTYSSTEIDEIKYIRLTYLGDGSGNVYLGEINGYDFLDDDETITSTPNDYIQLRVVEGTTVSKETPKLYNLTMTYAPSVAESESTVTSYYYTKPLDFDKPMLDKSLTDFFLETQATRPTTIYADYDIDDGVKTGTFTIPVTTSQSTVRLKKYFPSSAYGKNVKFKFYNNDRDSQVTIRAFETRFRENPPSD